MSILRHDAGNRAFRKSQSSQKGLKTGDWPAGKIFSQVFTPLKKRFFGRKFSHRFALRLLLR
jgi:hypothetical protein